MRLVIENNGPGSELSEALDFASGLGLAAMEERLNKKISRLVASRPRAGPKLAIS